MSRAVAGMVVTLPEPAISAGHPSLPENWARFAASATLIQGPNNIHAIPDPNPIWNPSTSGWTFPPPRVVPAFPGGGDGNGGGDCRWSVDTLPDPGGYPNGWYWLGEPSTRDDTGGIEVGARQWSPSPGSSGPDWNSFFPFKPSVSAYDAYIPGVGRIHHAKGVHCDSHYAEHMFADMAAGQGSITQPFTWIVVATVVSDPFNGYEHALLDAGRNPDAVGFPRSSASSVSSERRIGDDLPYRTSLTAMRDGTVAMSSQAGDNPLRVRGAPGSHPRMYAAIFNGAQSQVAAYDPFGKYISTGSVSNGAQSSHRFMVFGRHQGFISQRFASNILIFEIRYWHHALTLADLDGQYAQLSSTHQFDAYKSL